MNRVDNDLNIDKRDSYTFVFNSKFGNKTAQGANEVGYGVDWSVIPDQPYEIQFSYIGQVNNIDYSSLAQIYADLGTPTNSFFTTNSGTRTSCNTIQYLGVLTTYLIGTSSFFIAECATNPSIYIGGRPRNNTPIIRIYNNANPITLYTPATGALGDYILTMKFMPVK